MSWNAYCIPCTYIIYCISLVYLPCYMGLLCLGMLTILCLYYIYYSCTYMACDTWCACHAYWGFYFLKCLSYALLYLLVELYLCGLQHLVCLPYLWELLFLKMLILCLTVLISIYWLGVLAMLMGAFISCNAYFMPYYFCYSCTYIACNTWCTCHTYMGLLFLKMLILCFTILISIY